MLCNIDLPLKEKLLLGLRILISDISKFINLLSMGFILLFHVAGFVNQESVIIL